MTDTQTQAATIMVVDDEAIVTSSIGSLLRLEFGYEVVTFQSPRRALDYLQEDEVDMVISDFLMPDMNGIEFLRRVRELFPDVPRLMLTGYADKENAIRAINEIGLYQYLEKPWDNDQLGIVIRNGLEQKNLRSVLRARVLELDRTIRQSEALREVNDRLREELEVARRLQQQLLPNELPRNKSFRTAVLWEPALAVGGDFYDAAPLADDQTALLVADITGHGIQAALSTALLKFAFSRFRGSDATPADILIGINKVLHDGLPAGIFAAATVVTVDRRGERCHIANAGAPHPVIFRRSEARVERLPAEGLLLGVTDEDTFKPGETHRYELKSGDALLLTTDGLLEAANQDEEMFEGVKWPGILHSASDPTAEGLLAHLEEALESFRARPEDADDVTVLALEKL
jgi:serine phosphatase RsbU (regulator of sigma subunit)